MHHFAEGLEVVAAIADLIGIAILLIGAVRFLVQYGVYEFKSLRGKAGCEAMQALRLDLGRYILLSLEFLIISDIIHSALTRTLEDFLLLGLLVIIRTAISFFLGRELKEVAP